jgi:xylose isomerase
MGPFDAKIRRRSIDPDDLIYAHAVRWMPALAPSLLPLGVQNSQGWLAEQAGLENV